MMSENRITIKCKDCGNTFSIGEEEQAWYKERGFELPKRCKKCRVSKRERNKNGKN